MIFQAPFFYICRIMEIYFIIGGMLCFFVFGNLGIHLYFKKKHQQFLESLKGKEFIWIKSINMEMESSGKLGYRYLFNKADVVILDDEIFLLIFNKPIRQAQPILQISNTHNIFPYVSKKIAFDSKFIEKGKLKIKGSFGAGLTSGKYTVFLNFNNKDFDLNSIL
ncbi:hypothetical protein CHRYSEOSP005_22500 [Chryseobacterium sp. Alg-005]